MDALAVRRFPASPPLGCGAQLVLALLLGGAMLATLLLTPFLPCPGNCGPSEQLLGYTRLPGVRPEEAERLLAWGNSFPCSACRMRRHVSLLQALFTGCD
ncbi:MAG TPA: hypothetical protein VE981_01320 [Planctomycetota bacterium]|nr:hypothetical protein [Planctomycetota bacterium]